MGSFAVRFVVLVFSGALVGLLAGLLLHLLDVIDNPFLGIAPGIMIAAAWLVWERVGPDLTGKR